MVFWIIHDMNMLERIFYTSCKEEPLKRTEALSKLFEPLLTCFPFNNNNNAQSKDYQTDQVIAIAKR